MLCCGVCRVEIRGWQTRTHFGGHIVANTNVSVFPPARNIVADTNFASEAQKMFLIFCQKHFVSATNISSFARARKHHEQQYVRYNGSSFATASMLLLITGKTTGANWQWIHCSNSKFLPLIMLVTTPNYQY